MTEMTTAWFQANKPDDLDSDTSKFEKLLESYEARMKDVQEILDDPNADKGKIKTLSTGLSRITQRMKGEIRRLKRSQDEGFRNLLESCEESMASVHDSLAAAMKKG